MSFPGVEISHPGVGISFPRIGMAHSHAGMSFPDLEAVRFRSEEPEVPVPNPSGPFFVSLFETRPAWGALPLAGASKERKMPSWLSERQAERLLWIQNYALKLNANLGTAGIVIGDVTLPTACATRTSGS